MRNIHSCDVNCRGTRDRLVNAGLMVRLSFVCLAEAAGLASLPRGVRLNESSCGAPRPLVGEGRTEGARYACQKKMGSGALATLLRDLVEIRIGADGRIGDRTFRPVVIGSYETGGMVEKPSGCPQLRPQKPGKMWLRSHTRGFFCDSGMNRLKRQQLPRLSPSPISCFMLNYGHNNSSGEGHRVDVSSRVLVLPRPSANVSS
jgi:hypothetical protein